MSSAHENSGIIKKGSCITLQGSVPCLSEPGAPQLSPTCIACALLLWLKHFCFQSSHPLPMAGALCLFWSGLDPVLLVVQSLAALDLSQIQCFQRCDNTKFQGDLPHVFPGEVCVGGQGLQSDQMSTHSPPLGLSAEWYVQLSSPLHEAGGSLQSNPGPCWDCLHTTRLMVLL